MVLKREDDFSSKLFTTPNNATEVQLKAVA